jgi:hypothetical protein
MTNVGLVEIGKTYKIDFEIFDTVQGNITVTHPFTNTKAIGDGFYSWEGEAVSASFFFRNTSGVNDTLKIRNISVKEVIEENVPRIDFSNSTFDVPILGSELVTNGGFDTDLSGWTAVNAVWDNGKAKIDATSGSGYILQSICVIGKTYSISCDIEILSGSMKVTTAGGEAYTITQNGSYSFNLLASGTQLYFNRVASGDIFTIDNISVKEVTAYATDDNGAFLLEPASTNLYLNSETLATQDVTTSADIYTVSFRGTGTITFSGTYTGSLVGTGANDLVELTFTATAGTLTSTVTGTVSYGQCEALDYATSYIPTSGSTATRAAETCVDATPTINSEEGVLYFESSALVNGDGNRYVSISDGTANNRLQILYASTANRLNVNGTNVSPAITYNTFDQTVNHKIAVAYSVSGIKLFIDGVLIASTVTDASFPIGSITDLDFALYNSISSPFYGNTKDLRVYTEALTDAQLTELTTI